MKLEQNRMAYRNVLLSSKRAYSDIVQIQKSLGTSFDGWSPVIGLLQEQFGWTPKPIMHLLNFGYKSSAIFNITSVLPSTMVSLIQEIFCCLSFMLDQRDILLLDTSESKYNIQVRHDAHRVSSTSFSLHDDSLWEKEKALGLIQVEYDCDTYVRKHVSVNSRAAQLWNMNRAALLEKITNFDLPLPFCKLDWLCLLVFELEEYFQDETSFYTRLKFGTATHARAILACISSLKTFTPASRISKVTNHRLHRQTPNKCQ